MGGASLTDCAVCLVYSQVTIRRAMAGWQQANSNLRFFEVSSLCEGKWTNGSNTSPASVHGVGLWCEHAELVFGAYYPEAPSSGASLITSHLSHLNPIRPTLMHPILTHLPWLTLP